MKAGSHESSASTSDCDVLLCWHPVGLAIDATLIVVFNVASVVAFWATYKKMHDKSLNTDHEDAAS